MRRTCALLLAILLGLPVPGCGDSSDDDTMRVIVDHDGAFDDIKALLYLLERPDVEILAITVSGTGIAHCPVAAENTAALLERLDAPDIPVACGRSSPLQGTNQAPDIWRDVADTLGSVTLPEPRALAEVDAPALLIDTIEDAAAPVTIVALGPLTNVAEAIQSQPDVLDNVAMMYLMGGAVDDGGNVFYGNAAAEFNIWADPTAADMVFATQVPITLIPLDATNHLPVTPYLYEAVAAHSEVSPTASFVAEYLDATPLFGGMYHWDELAAVVATDESVATIEERNLAITLEPPGAEGTTIEDPAGRPVRVASEASRADFDALFYEALLGTSDPGIPTWNPDAVVTWDGTDCVYEGPDPLPANLYVRLDNESDGFLGLVTGAYNAGTTRADFEAALAAAEPGEPDWWLSSTQIVVPAGARDVWPLRGGEGLTALCYIDPSRVWEIAGPRLPED
ncbi:MAG: nucleoside hydrolase [Acidimicrobiia bacterium]|nr:nucleoside hydrolase [Acidimicrobiia bacterium]